MKRCLFLLPAIVAGFVFTAGAQVRNIKVPGGVVNIADAADFIINVFMLAFLVKLYFPHLTYSPIIPAQPRQQQLK